jgi:hypothetical protein
LLEHVVSPHHLLEIVELFLVMVVLVMVVRWSCKHNTLSARTGITKRMPFSISESALNLSLLWRWCVAPFAALDICFLFFRGIQKTKDPGRYSGRTGDQRKYLNRSTANKT